METIGKILVGIMLLVAAIVVGGYTVSLLWSWFVVPVSGLPALQIVEAIGIRMFVAYLGADVSAARRDTKDETIFQTFSTNMVSSILVSIIVIGSAYIITLFL